ncbi:MAG TPA: hypothetical protein PLI03_08365 [Chitinophagales bacterium]|nr:hypothetical protein [Chitinophagales bacterium]
MLKKVIFPVLLAMIWISIHEFVRNQVVLTQHWTDHYASMGLVFPADPVNGAVWGVWALLLAGFIRIITPKFSFMETVFLSWLAGFIMMWVVIGNMGVLPVQILPVAVPWSLLEVFGAVWITRKMAIVSE